MLVASTIQILWRPPETMLDHFVAGLQSPSDVLFVIVWYAFVAVLCHEILTHKKPSKGPREQGTSPRRCPAPPRAQLLPPLPNRTVDDTDDALRRARLDSIRNNPGPRWPDLND